MDDTPEPPSKYVLIAERARKVEEDRSVAREKYDLLRNCDRDELEEINAQVKALHDQIKTLLERGQQIQENDSALVAKRDQELAIIESQGDIDINSLCEGGTASLTVCKIPSTIPTLAFTPKSTSVSTDASKLIVLIIAGPRYCRSITSK